MGDNSSIITLFFFFRIIPVEAFHEVLKFFGAANFMDSFVGRKKTHQIDGTNGLHNGHDSVNGRAANN